ncbi:ATP-binding protein [Acetobacter sp. P1H12_c]|uniref:ATP-binding protein n=1 Tax=Acetobacter sp. P1H12_c TaxID=2762621 RepID=UPI001C044D95|nr:ATP-binding protein [Acetobacter sp. P1H12_c]
MARELMSAQELLLPRLNQALASIITACDAVMDGPINDKGETVEQALRPIMRRLLLNQTLGQYSLLAVAGTQGAGKTTLIKSLYDLKGEDAGWLKANEGRGETYPILITEGNPTAPVEGFLWKLEVSGDRREVVRRSLIDGSRSVEEAQQEFRRAASERDTDELLVELSLPGKLKLGPRKGWLLLPGYEARTADNEAWQSTMRAALAGASGSIIVTDETRLAKDQADLIRDAAKSALGNIDPVVVVTKTEDFKADPERLNALKVRAAEAFDVSIRQVQCVGVSDDQTYTDAWRNGLKEKINQFVAHAGGGIQDIRRTDLNNLIRQDLKRTLIDLNRHVRITLGGQNGTDAQAERLREMLEEFDDSATRLRKKYGKAIRGVVDVHARAAAGWLEKKVAQDFEGFLNHASTFFDTDTERLLKLKAVVVEADKHGGQLASKTATALIGPVQEVLARPKGFGHSHVLEPLRIGAPMDDRQYTAIPWERGGDIKNASSPAHALITLFSPMTGAESGEKLSGLDDAIKMLPALTLEWARVASEVPAVVVNTSSAEATVVDPVAYTLQNLGPAAENAQNLMKTVAQTMLAVDVASAGASAAGAAVGGVLANPVVLAGTALLAVGYLGVNMLQEIRVHDRANRASGLAMLQAAHDARIQEYMDAFDDLMEKARDNLEYVLRRRYRISDALAKKDRIVHAIAVAQQLREEFTEGLDPF